jgi:PKD repeat protein
MGVRFDGSKSSDPEGGALTYRWLFGDGRVGEGVNVEHTYEMEGDIDARLEVYDDSGALGNGAFVRVPVLAKHPPEPRSAWRKVVAANEEATYDGTSSSGRAWEVVRHEWRFGDGTVIEGPVVTHAFAKPGTYKITHIVQDGSGHHCDTAQEEFEVRVNAPPIAVAGPGQHVTASVVQFDGSASHDNDGDTVVRYDWDFGDGQAGSGPRPTNVYANPGVYTVTLTVADSSGTVRNTGSNAMQVVVNARPIADAGAELVGAPGQPLTFDGSRSVDPDGKIVEYLWDFRDGATASGGTVTHTFAKPGIYKVLLRVLDDTRHDAAIDFDEVRVFINTPPVADAGPDLIAAPGDPVRLSGARSSDADGSIASWRWDFSDAAAPMQGANVERRFDKPGVYTARLTVTDDSGAINANTSAEVRIAINHAPIAVAGENVVTNETMIAFDGTKSVDADGDALTYHWDFGDGGSASGARVTHTYKEGGTYPVVLTVDDGKGLHNSVARDALTVQIDRAPIAVAGENQTACTGDTLVFDGGKSFDPDGGVLRYLWDFGDGSRAEIVNPTKTYKQGGLYPVTLTVRDDSGLPRNFSTSRIAARIDQGPVANAGTSQILACANNAIVFDGSKSTDVDGVVNSYRWDFGDGNFGGGARPTHVYERPGKYRAFLTIQGEKVGQCSDTSTDEIAMEIIAGPLAVIAAPDAVPLTETVTFDGSGSKASDGKITGWHWDFGDGNKGTGARVTHKYAKAGTYRVQLTLTSDSASPTCREVSTRRLIAVNDPPKAIAKAKPLVAVDEEVVFDATGSSDPDGAIVKYEWDFGDGAKGEGVIARHRYRAPGAFKVKLTVHDNAGLANSVANHEMTVTVNAPPLPVVSGPEVACVGEAVKWSSEKSSDPDGKIATLRWSFGDGAGAAGANTTHQYKAPGRYSMTLYADDGAGLANSQNHVTRSIWVNQPPSAAAGPERIVCPGAPVKFDGSMSSDSDGKLTRFQWNFGDGTTKDGAQAEHVFAKPGNYRVRLTVADNSGSSCATDTAEVNVLVKAPPVARAGGDREIWVGGAHDTVLLDGSASNDPDGKTLSYVWEIGEGMSAVGRRVLQTIPTPGEYRAKLTVSDPSGLSCGTATDSFIIIARERK